MRCSIPGLVLAALVATATAPISADASEIAQLDLDTRCGQCHDVSDRGGLAADNWLARLEEMGPIEDLSPAEQAEVLGFIRYHGWEVSEIVEMADERHLFEEKCGLCHSANRIFVRELDDESQRSTVLRMRNRAPEWISEAEADAILTFLEKGARGISRPEHVAISATADGADVFRIRCSACHPLERSYLYLETHRAATAWGPLVKRMQLKAPEWISDSESALIVEYLSSQKPML